MSFLLGVPGKLNAISNSIATLLSRVSETVVNRIDAAVSSRAPASTALSTDQWSNGRAALLDELTKVEGVRTNPVLAAPTSFVTPLSIEQLQSGLSPTSIPRSTVSVATSFVTILSLTGRGVVNFLAPVNVSGTATQTFRITIDGTVAYTGTIANTSGRGNVIVGAANVSSGVLQQLCLEDVAFNSSFLVEASSSSIVSNTAGLFFKWRRSA